MRHPPAPRLVRAATDPPSADATTFLAFVVALQFVLPSSLVLNHLPLSLSAATLVALGLGGLWLCTQLTSTLGAAKGGNPVRTALLGYVVVLLVAFGASGIAYLPADERSVGDHTNVTMIALVFVGLAVVDGVTRRERLLFLLRVVVGCAALVAVVGILQFLVDFDLRPYLSPPGMHATADDPSTLARSGLIRVSGTTGHPIEFGVLCAMVLPLALHLAFARADAHRSRIWAWACVGLLAAGVMFSVSRSAVVALLCVATVLFVGWSRERRVRMLVAGVGFLVVVEVMAPSILQTFWDLFTGVENDASVSWRTHDYATARELIAQRPVLGRGLGTWYAPKHEVFDNQYLLTLVDTGILGLIALLGIFGAGVYAAGRVVYLTSRATAERLPMGGRDGDLALSLMASLMAVFPAFATFDFMSFGTVATLAFLLAGLSGALLRVVLRESDEQAAARDVRGTSPAPWTTASR